MIARIYFGEQESSTEDGKLLSCPPLFQKCSTFPPKNGTRFLGYFCWNVLSQCLLLVAECLTFQSNERGYVTISSVTLKSPKDIFISVETK